MGGVGSSQWRQSLQAGEASSVHSPVLTQAACVGRLPLCSLHQQAAPLCRCAAVAGGAGYRGQGRRAASWRACATHRWLSENSPSAPLSSSPPMSRPLSPPLGRRAPETGARACCMGWWRAATAAARARGSGEVRMHEAARGWPGRAARPRDRRPVQACNEDEGAPTLADAAAAAAATCMASERAGRAGSSRPGQQRGRQMHIRPFKTPPLLHFCTLSIDQSLMSAHLCSKLLSDTKRQRRLARAGGPCHQ